MDTARLVVLTIIAIALTTSVACGRNSDDDAGARTDTTRGPTELNELQERRAIRDLMDEGEVLDATMSQTATTASLKLVVVNEVSDIRAKELGTLFVRMVKQRGPNRQNDGGGRRGPEQVGLKFPGLAIGVGNVEYSIIVKYSDDKKVAQGTKARTAKSVTWEGS